MGVVGTEDGDTVGIAEGVPVVGTEDTVGAGAGGRNVTVISSMATEPGPTASVSVQPRFDTETLPTVSQIGGTADVEKPNSAGRLDGDGSRPPGLT